MLSPDDKKPERPSDHNSRAVPHEILIAEFEYLADAAQQANEAKVIQYYFMVLGALVGSVVGLREIPPAYLQLVYGALMLIFLILTVFGVFTVRQLIGLRLAWLEYSLAMDKIKEYYIDRFSNASLPSAMRLRVDKLPLAYQPGTISHLLALTIFLINALFLLIASAFLQLTLFNSLQFGSVTIAGLVLAVLLAGGQQLYYRMKLEKSGIQKDIFDEIENVKKKRQQAEA